MKKYHIYLDQLNFARASRFFEHFFAVVARLQRESAYFAEWRATQDKNFHFLLLNFGTVLSNLSPKTFAKIWRS